ncbi:unnamed protein product [Arctogadus glacialis]
MCSPLTCPSSEPNVFSARWPCSAGERTNPPVSFVCQPIVQSFFILKSHQLVFLLILFSYTRLLITHRYQLQPSLTVTGLKRRKNASKKHKCLNIGIVVYFVYFDIYSLLVVNPSLRGEGMHLSCCFGRLICRNDCPRVNMKHLELSRSNQLVHAGSGALRLLSQNHSGHGVW